MALIKCPKCKNEVSDKNIFCFQCNYKLIEDDYTPKKKFKLNFIHWLGINTIVFGSILTVLACYNNQSILEIDHDTFSVVRYGINTTFLKYGLNSSITFGVGLLIIGCFLVEYVSTGIFRIQILGVLLSYFSVIIGIFYWLLNKFLGYKYIVSGLPIIGNNWSLLNSILIISFFLGVSFVVLGHVRGSNK